MTTMNKDAKKIGEVLRELRIKAGETQEQVAVAIGVTPMAVSLYEQGARIPRDVYKKAICNHFNVSVDIFF